MSHCVGMGYANIAFDQEEKFWLISIESKRRQHRWLK